MREAWSHSATERAKVRAQQYRALTEDERLALAHDVSGLSRVLHGMYVRCFYPNATNQLVVDHWGRVTLEPELYLEVRKHRMKLGYDVLPLPMPDDIRLDAFIRTALTLEQRQVFCEQYHETEPSTAAV